MLFFGGDYNPEQWPEEVWEEYAQHRTASGARWRAGVAKLFIDGVIDALKWDCVPGHAVGTGSQWALPMGWEINILTYNKQILADHNITPPKTAEELLAAAEPPTAAGGDALEESRQRLMREGRIGARLQQPLVISMFDVVVHEDRPWLVMEYLPSRSLAAMLVEKGPFAPREAAEVGRQVADGLAAAMDSLATTGSDLAVLRYGRLRDGDARPAAPAAGEGNARP